MKNSIIITGSPDKPETYIYKNERGMYIRTAEFKSKKNGTNPIRILHFTDVHINFTNEQDKENKEIMYTKKFRHWNENAASLKALNKVMDYAQDEKFDKTIITGDVLDYMSLGAMQLMEKYIWDRDPDVTVTLGNHEYVRQMETDMSDQTPIESRIAIIENFWHHNIYYTSEILGDKVMVISLDNSQYRYWDFQVDKLRADIEKARKEHLIILIFQHCAISTGNPSDTHVKALCEYDGAEENFYDDPLVINTQNSDYASLSVYNMITDNADVIKGLFCGHYHSGYYTEVRGRYTDSNGAHETVIPQYIEEGVVYDDYAGHVLEIIIN